MGIESTITTLYYICIVLYIILNIILLIPCVVAQHLSKNYNTNFIQSMVELNYHC